MQEEPPFRTARFPSCLRHPFTQAAGACALTVRRVRICARLEEAVVGEAVRDAAGLGHRKVLCDRVEEALKKRRASVTRHSWAAGAVLHAIHDETAGGRDTPRRVRLQVAACTATYARSAGNASQASGRGRRSIAPAAEIPRKPAPAHSAAGVHCAWLQLCAAISPRKTSHA